MEHARRTDNNAALAAVKVTLDNVRHGGIYDQIGFGITAYICTHFACQAPTASPEAAASMLDGQRVTE